jgi:hypothetical protein
MFHVPGFPVGSFSPILIVEYISWALDLFVIVLHLAAFVDCLTRRADAFPAAGKLSKGAWLLIIGLALVVTLVLGGGLGILGVIGIIASLVYFLDVRPAVKEITSGGNRW